MARIDRMARLSFGGAVLAAAALLSVASPKKTGIPDDPFASSGASPPSEPQPSRSTQPLVEASLPYPACPSPAGVILRQHLTTILDRGPGVFLQGVDVTMITKANLPGGKPFWKQPTATGIFGGWLVRRFHPEDPCLRRAGIGPGDIIAEVNGTVLQHPDDLARLWKSLRGASNILVRLYRDGRPLVFVVKISGDTGSPK